MLVAVDIGNSRLKLGAFDGDRLVAVEAIEGGRNLAAAAIPFPHLYGADEVVVGCSAPDQLAEFRSRVTRAMRVLDASVVAAVDTTYDDPAELGVDRLAAAWGAAAVSGHASVVVADVGTATTVDALDADGRFVALAIAPGPRAAARGLREAAPHLPLPVSGREPALPARGSVDSLRNGQIFQAAATIDRLVLAARGLVGEATPVVVTGGGASAVAPLLATAHTVYADCVLHGLRALHEAVPE